MLNHANFVMPCGSGIADPVAQNRYQFSMMPRGSGIADPGAQNRYQSFMPVPHFCFNTGTVLLFITGTVLLYGYCMSTGTVPF